VGGSEEGKKEAEIACVHSVSVQTYLFQDCGASMNDTDCIVNTMVTPALIRRHNGIAGTPSRLLSHCRIRTITLDNHQDGHLRAP
jgi:hypothetical protein